MHCVTQDTPSPPPPPSVHSIGDARARAEARPRVLVVEDDVDIAESLADWLDIEHFGVDLARDGETAVEHARDLVPDVILLDLMLPRLDGVGVAAALRHYHLGEVPVILLSAGRHLEDAARRVGTPYWLRKPYDLDDLLRLIRRALDEHPRGHAAT